MTERTPQYIVVEHKGWSYVIGGAAAESGPWRYRWEAQEYANELNRRFDDEEQKR
jgi:hypothetical protein